MIKKNNLRKLVSSRGSKHPKQGPSQPAASRAEEAVVSVPPPSNESARPTLLPATSGPAEGSKKKKKGSWSHRKKKSVSRHVAGVGATLAGNLLRRHKRIERASHPPPPSRNSEGGGSSVSKRISSASIEGGRAPPTPTEKKSSVEVNETPSKVKSKPRSTPPGFAASEVLQENALPPSTESSPASVSASFLPVLALHEQPDPTRQVSVAGSDKPPANPALDRWPVQETRPGTSVPEAQESSEKKKQKKKSARKLISKAFHKKPSKKKKKIKEDISSDAFEESVGKREAETEIPVPQKIKEDTSSDASEESVGKREAETESPVPQQSTEYHTRGIDIKAAKDPQEPSETSPPVDIEASVDPPEFAVETPSETTVAADFVDEPSLPGIQQPRAVWDEEDAASTATDDEKATVGLLRTLSLRTDSKLALQALADGTDINESTASVLLPKKNGTAGSIFSASVTARSIAPTRAKSTMGDAIRGSVAKMVVKASLGGMGLGKNPLRPDGLVGGEETDDVVKKVPMRAMDGVALGGVAASIACMGFTVGHIVDLASVATCLFSPYAAVQKRKLAGLGGMRGQQNELRGHVNDLHDENNKLHSSVDRLESSVSKLEEVEKGLSELCDTTNVDRLVHVVKENARIQKEIKALLEAEIMQNVLTCVMRSNRGDDFVMGPSEINMLIFRMRNMPSVDFNEEKFREHLGDREEVSLTVIMDIFKNLLDDDVSDEENIFKLQPEAILEKKA